MTNQEMVTTQMQQQVDRWLSSSDRRAIFLNCYMLMTQNMLLAIEQREFHDGRWVNQLLHRFADYYFEALRIYEEREEEAPAVWRQTHNACCSAETLSVQHLLLGVNAHINYDLVLALADLLEPEWNQISTSHRQVRYIDHCRVNEVIAQTIDSVQEEVVERFTPEMDIVDRMMGPIDEWLAAWLIKRWRDEVWHNTIRFIETPSIGQREQLRQQIEAQTLRRAESILMTESPRALRHLL